MTVQWIIIYVLRHYFIVKYVIIYNFLKSTEFTNWMNCIYTYTLIINTAFKNDCTMNYYLEFIPTSLLLS